MEFRSPQKTAVPSLFPTMTKVVFSHISSPKTTGEDAERSDGGVDIRQELDFELEGDIETVQQENGERAVLAGIMAEKSIQRLKIRTLHSAFHALKKVQTHESPIRRSNPLSKSRGRVLQLSTPPLVSVLSSVLTVHIQSSNQDLFTLLRSLPRKPISKIKSGLALLQRRFQQRNSAPYATMKNSKLSQLLLNDFSLSILSRVANSLSAKLKSEAFVRIKFTNASRMFTIAVKKLILVSKARTRKSLRGRFNQWVWARDWNKRERKRRKESIGKGLLILHHISAVTGPMKNRLRRWRHQTALFRSWYLRQIKAGLVAAKLTVLKKTIMHQSWVKIAVFARNKRLGREQVSSFVCALENVWVRNGYQLPFAAIKAEYRLKARRLLALQRVLKLQRYKRALLTAKFLGRFSHRLASSALYSKRKSLRQKHSSRLLLTALRGLVRSREQHGWELVKRAAGTTVRVGRLRVSEIQRDVKMARALYRLRTALRIAKQQAMDVWRGGSGREEQLRAALRMRQEAWAAVKRPQLTPPTSRRTPSETRPQTLRSQRSTGKTKRGSDCSDIGEGIRLARELAESQTRAHQRLQELLQSPVLHRPDSLPGTKRLSVVPLVRALRRAMCKEAFSTLKKQREVKPWKELSFSLTRRSAIVHFLLERLAAGPTRLAVSLQQFAFSRISHHRSAASYHAFQTIHNCLSRKYGQSALYAVRKWREYTRKRRSWDRQRVRVIASALQIPVNRWQIYAESVAIRALKSASHTAKARLKALSRLSIYAKLHRRLSLLQTVE